MITIEMTGNNMGQIDVELTVVNNLGVTTFSSTQTGNAGQAVILTMCKSGFGCVQSEIVFGCCDAEATMALLSGTSDTICNGDSTALKFTGMNGTAPYTVTVRAATATDTTYFDVVIPDDMDGNPAMDMDTIFVHPTDTTTYCAISVEDANGCTQPVTSDKVTVKVVPLPVITLTATAPDVVTCGDVVDITIVTTDGFDDLLSLQYSVNWDETQLKYVSHSALQIGGAGGDPSVGTANALSDGELTYSWLSPGIVGQTVGNGTTLLTITMQVVGSSGSAVVDLTGTPLAFEVEGENFCAGTIIPQNNVDIALNAIVVNCPDDFAICSSALPLDLTTLSVSPTGGTFSGPGVSGNSFSAAAGTTNTITYTYTNPDTDCTGFCTFDITVVATPAVDPVDDQAVCVGDNVAQINFSANVPGATFTWTRTPEAIGLGATNGGNFVPAFTAANAGTTPLTSTFSVTATFTANGLTCTGTPIEFEITVNPVPTVEPVDNQTVCNGQQTDPVIFSGNVSGTVFNWTNNTPSIGLAASGSGNIAAFTAINNTNAPVVATITVTPAFTFGGTTCTGLPVAFTITVNPTPGVNAVPDQTYCTGANVPQITFSGNTPGATFSWTRTPAAIGLPANSGGNFVPAFLSANAGNAPLTSTFTVTPSFTGNGVTCPGTPVEFDISVNPTPTVDPVASQTVCNNSPTTPVLFSSPVAGTVFNWTNDNISIGLGASGTGSIPAFIALNNTISPVTATITVTPLFTNNSVQCSGSPVVFTITVNPTPTVAPVANQLLCSGETTAAVAFTGTVPGTVFNWTNSNTGIGLAASGTGDIPPFVTLNAGNTPLVATITVTPTFTNNGVTCSGAPIQFTITVDPRPTVFAGFDQIICQDQSAVLLAVLGGGATGGTWTGGAGVFSSPNTPGTNYTPTPAEYGTTIKLAFTTNDPAGPCPSASDTVAVTINTLPIVNAGTDIMICKDENLDLSKLGASILANGSGITTGTWSTSGSGAFQPNNAFPPGATTYIPSAADRAAGSVALTLTSSDPAGPCNPVSDQVILAFQPAGGLVCNDNVQIALGETGMEEVTPDAVLEAPYLNGMYKVEVFVNGVFVGNKVDCSHIGKNVVVKVTDECSGVFCMTTITVVDNFLPKLTCTDIVLNCAITDYSPNYLQNVLGISHAYPVVQENCAQFTLTRSDTWHDLTCADAYIGYARRVWTATDAYGNKGTCIQIIYFEQKEIEDLTLPGDVTLECNGSGPVNTAPQFTGVPYLTDFGINFPIWPGAGFCKLSATFTDNKLPSCDGSYDIIRTWVLYDGCKPTTPTPPTTNPKYHVQLIRVTDKTGPVLDCPADMTVSTDALACCATVDLPDMIIFDACSKIRNATARIEVRHPITGDVLATYDVTGALTTFPGNNPNTPDTLAVFGFTPCLPEGTHTVTYHVEDNCGNTSNCSFDLTVDDLTPPVPACDEITQVALGIDGMNFVNASTFDDGSYDACSNVYFKARRIEVNACQPVDSLYDQVKFCCEDIGDTILVILRVYDAQPPVGTVSLDWDDANYNECQVQVYVEDKLKPTCSAPAHVTVACENFDPTLWAYGMATGTDNCCIDTVLTLVNLNQFDTVCNKGTITRTFRVVDCGGQSTTCTQRIVVNYTQNYFVRFPNDWNITECNSGFDNFGKPEFFGQDCELLGVTYQDVTFTVVPDACFKIERNWTIVNWCTFDPNQPCIEVPNPNPNALNDHPSNLVGPTVSPAGTPAPWTPTNVRIHPTDLQPTNFSTFWSANANCYKYKQIIKITDKKTPDIQCPTSPVEVCDETANSPQLWNETYWYDNATGSHNLCEAPVDLCITATDDCSLSDLKIHYQLFLDLDNNGDMETVINSFNPPPPNTVYFGNANNPNFSGGTPRAFDSRAVALNQKYQFTIQTSVSGDDKIACLRWNTQLQPNDFVIPELPYGTHKIKWFVEDGCGNERVCEYTFVIKDCKAPTINCFNGLSINLMPTKMITIDQQFFVQDAYDNCSPSGLLLFGIRRANIGGTGFPFNPDGTPQTSVTFDCSNLGFNPVEVWVMDLAGNSDFCTTYIHVQDNAGVCTSNNATVAGMLQTESGQGVEDVDVQVKVSTATGQPTYNATVTTDQDGYFIQPNALPQASGTIIEPVKDNDPLNGVSTYDLVLINKHILGLQPLTSPYKMIAADANYSRSITTADIVELRKLILGIHTELPNNTSWRFVDKNYAFPNPSNPFQEIFPETKEIVDPQTHQMYEDFVGVKTGDVNGNAVTNSLLSTQDRTVGTLMFDVDDRVVKAGETFLVELRPADASTGYQFTLYHPGLQVVDVRPGGGMSADNFGIFPQEQSLTASYFSTETAGGFAVTFRATNAGTLSRMLSLSSRITRAEAYREDTEGTAPEVLDLALRFNSGETPVVAGVGLELYQNQPNPWTNRTRLGFHLPETSEAVLTVYDEAGTVLYSRAETFAQGYNAVTIDNTVLSSASGLMFYKLETPKGSAVRRMIKM